MLRKGSRILITGGGSGIGRSLAREAARRGYLVAICGRRREALQETAADLPDACAPIMIEADLTEATGRARVVSRLLDAGDPINLLINNAGIVPGGRAEDVGDALLEATFRTNVMAPMALARDLFPLLVASRPSRVVNVGSVFGEIAYPGFAAYSASKFALRGLSDALRREWKPYGVGVTHVALRATRTDAAAAFDQLIRDGGMSLDSPDHAATAILDAAHAGVASSLPAGLERLFVLVQRLFPSLIDRSLTGRVST